MTRALGLSAFVLMLLSPFVDFVHFRLMAALFIIAFASWVLSEIIRPKSQEIDFVRLQRELSEFVRDLNRHG